MSYYVLKTAVTVALVVLVSEISKRSSVAGALLASVPLVSVMAFVWLYVDTRDTAQVAALARNIGWLVLPSLALFIALPIMLTRGYGFYLSLAMSIALTVVAYLLALLVGRQLGVSS